MYKKLLVAYDGSLSSKSALKEALEISASFDSYITIISVFDLPTEIFGFTSLESERFESELYTMLLNAFEQAKEKNKMVSAYFATIAGDSATYTNIESSEKIQIPKRVSSPDSAIVAFSEFLKPDLIIIGTRGYNRVINVGSVTVGVIRDAPCDVLTIKTYKEGRFEEKYKNILIAFDGSETSINALKRTINIAKRFNWELTAIHVYPLLTEINLFSSVHTREVLLQTSKHILERAREIAYKEGYPIYTHSGGFGDPAEYIVNYATEENYDLVVLGTQNPSAVKKVLIGSIAYRIISEADFPVYCIPVKSQKRKI
ncbi:universal stress protein [Thermodesulfobium sp.]|jgi:nucleotide-binding universal stress UspA family protein